MDAFRGIRRDVLKLKYQLTAASVEIKLRKLICALKAGFDPAQPRDEQGRWIGSGMALSRARAHISRLASYSNIAACNVQYKSDIFHCKMVGLSTCYAQAMVRLVACERGQPIPPLNY